MKNIAALFCICLFILGFSHCKNSVEPEDKPGTRNYTWSVDTIIIPFTDLSRITGTGPDDLWAIGSGGGLDKTIWHYDNNSWQTDGVSRPISPWCVHSISRNSVWLAGQDGKVWRYNGQSWSENYTHKKKNWAITFLYIGGDSDQNLFALGSADSSNTRKPVIIKYNGYSWGELNIPAFTTYSFVKIKKDNQSGKYYIMGWGSKSNGGDLYGLFELSGTQIKQIYEGEIMPGIIQVNNRVLFSFNTRICFYSNNDFVTITTNNDINSWWLLLSARSEKDIFLWVSDGIAQYNGTDMKYVYKITTPMSITDGILFDNDVFFIGSNPSIGATYIIRGKMNK